MSVFITSDIHFNHKNLMKYCPESRPFSSVEEMDETIIRNWNKKVTVNDSVYILGDVSFAKPSATVNFLYRLNGKLFLVVGNHDTDKYLKEDTFIDRFEWVKLYNDEKLFGKHIVMFHFPIASWHRKNYGAIHLHGHCHGTPTNISGRIKDVGWDTNQNVYNLEEIIEEMEKITCF